MTLRELMILCEAEADVSADLDQDLTAGYTSDLLSDVMAHAPDGCVLVTIQNHRNTVAVATLVGARAILICHDRPVPDEMRDAARAESVVILRTKLDQFHATCRIGARLAAR